MRQNDSPFSETERQEQIKFYLTRPSPCPYLEGQMERKVFTNLGPDGDPSALHERLSSSGFRRSQNIIYRPACAACNACKATRVPVQKFELTKRWRRIVKKNANLVRGAVRPVATAEQYRLMKRYLMGRHKDGGMSDMSISDYISMVEDSPVPSVVFEYRLGDGDDAPLIAAAITDVMRDGLSMVYSFFDPDFAKQSIGSFIILDHIAHAKELGIEHVFLGYWVKNSDKMDYKARFRPLEVLDGDVWSDIEHQR